MKNIAILMTCHNRRDTTLRCLRALFENELPSGLSFKVLLVDDGSTDGTSDAVRLQFPSVEIFTGDGNLFWNRGMRLAFGHAMSSGLFDAYIWLNDDTILRGDAISELIRLAKLKSESVVVVGAICDPISGERTYGGSRRISPVLRPFLCSAVFPNGEPQDVDVVNGNILLIPNDIALRTGNLDPVFEHAMGDIDYSFRVRKLGVRIVMTPDYVGVCARNSKAGTYHDAGLSVWQRLKHAFSRKGLPWRSWLTMCWRHGGIIWPVYFVWGYTKIIVGRA